MVQTPAQYYNLYGTTTAMVDDPMVELLKKTMQENDLDELNRLLDSEAGSLDVLITTKITYDEDEKNIDLTAIQWAAAFSEPPIINLLLNRGSRIDEEIPDIGGTALHLASQYNSEINIALLLSQGLNGISLLFYVWRSGDSKFLYERGSQSYIDEANSQCATPLHIASEHGHENVVKWLLDYGVSINQQGPGGNTSLCLATTNGHVETVRELLGRKAEIHKKNDQAYSPILLACANACKEVFTILIGAGALTSDVMEEHDTCFHHVVRCDWELSEEIVSIMTILVFQGADINQLNAMGISPLVQVCLEHKLEHVELLLRCGANPNQMSLQNLNPLMAACTNTDNGMIKLLLQHNADSTIRSNFGITALELAVKSGQPDTVKLLIQSGADVTFPSYGGTIPLAAAILHWNNLEVGLEILAAEKYYPRDPSAKHHYMESTDMLREIEIGLLQGLESADHKTLEQLHVITYWAVFNNAMELAERCIDQDQRVLHWTREGATWLHIASKSGMVEIAKFLLGRMAMQSDGPDQPLGGLVLVPHRTTSNHRKGLIESYPDIAAQILEFLAPHEEPGNEEILKEFLRSGDKRDIKNSEGLTALQWAVHRSQPVVIWWLLSKGGYSSHERKSASKLIKNKDEESEVIGKLLLEPPPTLDHVSNPNKKHVFKSLTFLDKNLALSYRGSIVDILSGAESKRIAYADRSVNDLIYKFGPDSIMRAGGEDLSQCDLYRLKQRLKKDYRPPTSSSSIQEQIFPDPANSTSAHHDRPDNKNSSSGNPHEFHLRWIYLPVNELRPSEFLHLMRDLVSRLSSDSKRSEGEHMTIMKHFNRSWTELAAGAERYYMKPQFVRSLNTHHNYSTSNADGNQTPKELNTGACTAIYMPYLDIGTYHPRVNESPTTEHPTVLDESITDRNSRAIKHMPMTLDQHYYPTIDDTSGRDNDQVLSKFLQEKSGKSKDGKKILMVNQLWIWIIDEKTIITATTQNPSKTSKQSSKADREPPESLLQNALDNILHGETKSQFERARTVDFLMELLLGVASGLFMKRFVPVSDKIYKGPIEIFRESIRDVICYCTQRIIAFQEFLKGLQEANPREPEQKEGQPSSEESDFKSSERPMPLNRYHVISSETKLLNMIRDIHDELHMLRSLAEDQEIVWKQAFPSSDLMHFKAYTPTNVKKDLNAMLSEADKTENYINTMLDLRQADFGRLQAYDSARQSNSIFIFTMMTIVFLPLSFLTSLFALNVSDFPHEGDNVQYKGWWIFPIIFGVTALISVPAIIFAWKVDAISSFRSRNNITSDSSTHTDTIKEVLSNMRRRGRKHHDIEAK
ncbi:hypothetical protein EAE96_011278 [Botrytis aclada]|nr:hypothetical protein EAE96_011278 [Botrytis aclada]